jgi:EAL domain-containing protein (putative c-di-GMP-specific phosphodiesterase class I)
MISMSRAEPNQLVVEMTEAAAMSEIDATLRFMRQLKEMGCRFALDDFGCGFSSFYYLKRFEADYLKVADSLIRDLKSDHSNRVFVKALNDFGRGMRKQIIAECVESADVLQLLVEAGGQYAQGHLFQQPMPVTYPPASEAGAEAMTA